MRAHDAGQRALVGDAPAPHSPAAPPAPPVPPHASALQEGEVRQAEQLRIVSIVGSRRVGNTSATDTPVPVDYIPLTKAAEQGGQFDLAQTLTNISPSFNSTRQTGADGADLVDSAALRGLGSDQTLVLVNGKRRHTTALVNLFGARNRGNTGTDMNALPLLAIKDVQVLRDGAAAQYGSDAIAGVINVELKKSLGCESIAGFGEYSKHDGKNWICLGLLRRRGGGRRAGHHRRILRPRPLQPRRSRQPAHHRRHQDPEQDRLRERRIPGRPGQAVPDGRRPDPRRLLGRLGARRHRFRRHPVAQLGRHVPGRLRPLHQRRHRRPLRHPRLPHPHRRMGRRLLADLRLQPHALHHRAHAERLDREPRPEPAARASARRSSTPAASRSAS
jgi:hypothetical protein